MKAQEVVGNDQDTFKQNPWQKQRFVVFHSIDIEPLLDARNCDKSTGHLVHKYLLGTYNMPGTVLGTEDTGENPALMN